MEGFMSIVKFIVEHHEAIIAAIVSILTGVMAIALLIPGEQPEKTLKKILEFISKFSRKPKAE